MEGTLKYEDSEEVYTGSFVDGQKACGTITYKNGDEFSGDFKNSRRFCGVMRFANSSEIYQGEFNEFGQFHGYAKHTTSDGDHYSGCFVNGQRQGQGQLILGDGGGTYTGEFFNNEMHGNGCFTMPGGAEYIGEF